MKKIVALGLIISLVWACKDQQQTEAKPQTEKEIVEQIEKNTIDDLLWLVGAWTNINSESQSYETWVKSNDSTLSAISYTTVKGDTVFAEKIKLQAKKNSTHFTVTALGQNDDLPVTFTLISKENNIFSFENKNHDFPKSIHYSNKVQDSLHAWIEGVIDGETRRVDFSFKKEN